jgi:hypothetical protein
MNCGERAIPKKTVMVALMSLVDKSLKVLSNVE